MGQRCLTDQASTWLSSHGPDSVMKAPSAFLAALPWTISGRIWRIGGPRLAVHQRRWARFPGLVRWHCASWHCEHGLRRSGHSGGHRQPCGCSSSPHYRGCSSFSWRPLRGGTFPGGTHPSPAQLPQRLHQRRVPLWRHPKVQVRLLLLEGAAAEPVKSAPPNGALNLPAAAQDENRRARHGRDSLPAASGSRPNRGLDSRAPAPTRRTRCQSHRPLRRPGLDAALSPKRSGENSSTSSSLDFLPPVGTNAQRRSRQRGAEQQAASLVAQATGASQTTASVAKTARVHTGTCEASKGASREP